MLKNKKIKQIGVALVVMIAQFSCQEETPCSRFDVERNMEYEAPANGKVWAFSNAAICTIYVNNLEVASDKGTSTLVQKGDVFRVTKSQVNIPHTFQSWFDCAE